MKHHVINIASKELRCRLNTQNTIQLEKKLGGKSVLRVLMDEQIPSLDMIMNTLHASLQAIEHGYTIEKVYELYDQYVEEGMTYTDLIPELISVLEVSGFFKRPPQDQEEQQKQEKETE